jgi:uncharacterized membrane protein
MLVSLDPKLIALTRRNGLRQEDVEQVSNLLAHSWPAFLLVLALVVALLSTLMGGIYRLVLRPGERGFLHLRFGPDELRLTGLNLLLFGVGMVCLTAEIAALSSAGQGGLGVIAAVVLPLITLWLGVRLSLATPMTFDRRRFAIQDAWAATSGRFWPLSWMILLAVVFYVLVWLLISVIGMALLAMVGGQAAMDDIRSLNGAAILGVALYVFMQLVLQVIQIVMIYAPFAVAYQQLRDEASDGASPHVASA